MAAKRTLRIGLGEIDKAMAEVERIKRNIQANTSRLIPRLAQAGVEIASARLLAHGAIAEGELDAGMHYLIEDKGDGTLRAYIRTDSDHAAFVEFGTGVRGAETPHPTLPWAYDIHGHGAGGWWYPTTASDPNPTKRRAKDGTFWAWTAGMPARPFMYETARELRERVGDMAKEEFTS